MNIKDKIAQIGVAKLFTIMAICLICFMIVFVSGDNPPLPNGEIFDSDANTKTMNFNNITIVAPSDINCIWSNSSADWKLCEVILAVTNKDTVQDFIEKNNPMSDFKNNVSDLQVYESPLLNTYQKAIVNSTCMDILNLTEENDTEICQYNVTAYNFNDWKLKTKLDKFPKNDTKGVKLVFKAPISSDAGNYIKNQFNFSIFSDEYNVTLDPDISTCAILNETGATYNLTADITNSATSFCMNISANNITLDCQGHTIDGNDAADYGIYLSRSSEQTTNVTIKNCTLTDWDTEAIRVYNSHHNKIQDILFNSNPDYSVGNRYSDYNNYININSSNNNYAFYINYGDHNNFTNINSYDESTEGVKIWYGSYNKFLNSSFYRCGRGLDFSSASGNILQNVNIINSTYYDFYISADSDSYCNHQFINVTGTDNKPILYFNETVNLNNWNNNFSEIILCNADNSIIDNLNMSHTFQNNALMLVRTDNVTVKNSFFHNLKDGIRSWRLSGNWFYNITMDSISEYGLYMERSGTSLFDNLKISNSYGGFYFPYSGAGHVLNNILINGTTNYGIRDGDTTIVANSTIINNANYGIYVYDDNNIYYNLTLDSNKYGFYLYSGSDNNIIRDCKITNSSTYGVFMSSPASVSPNFIYNNLFNNSDNFYLSDDVDDNYFNTTNQIGTRIYSNGTNIGGNYYTNSTGNGFSDICTDSDKDGFCDSAYDVKNDTAGCTSNNCDYLALSSKYSPNTAPNLTANATSPATVYTNTDWLINLTAIDAEESYLDSYVQFYMNDTKIGGEYTYNMTNNTNSLVATLGSGNFSKGYNLTAEVWIGDGTENTTKVNLTVATVQNSAPVITTLQTTVNQNTSSTYNFDYNFTDADGDTVTVSDNTTLFNINSSTGIISDTPIESEVGTYIILITASDGIDSDTDVFSYVIVDTTSPVVNLVSPEQGTQDKDGIVRFIFNVTETNEISNCSLFYQDGIYSTTTNVVNGSDNVIEVVGIEENHPLSNSNLRWGINCTDEFGNTGISEIRDLDTKAEEIISGGTGGGTSTVIVKSPKSMTLSYPIEWKQGKRVNVEITIFDKNNNKYETKNIFNQYNISGLDFIDNVFKEDSLSYLMTFGVRQDAELGNKSIIIFAEDETQISSTINMEIVKHTVVEDEESVYKEEEKPSTDWIKDNAVAISIISIIFLIIILIVFVLA